MHYCRKYSPLCTCRMKYLSYFISHGAVIVTGIRYLAWVQLCISVQGDQKNLFSLHGCCNDLKQCVVEYDANLTKKQRLRRAKERTYQNILIILVPRLHELFPSG